MELQHIWLLRGANVWARCPVMEVELALAEDAAADGQHLADCTTRLRSWLPSLADNSIGPDLPALLHAVTLELQRSVGSPVQVGRVRPSSDGIFRVAIEFE